jgi:EAL domain-containing protein (putative c-di-GMP-specific phosphodiesterase class I)
MHGRAGAFYDSKHKSFTSSFDADGTSMAFQPIVSATKSGVIIYGYEALARATSGKRSPLLVSYCKPRRYAFDAHCRRLALFSAKTLGIEGCLSVNVTPGVICHPRYGIAETVRFAQEIEFPLNRLVLEITEREAVKDYKPIRACIDRFRRDGMRVALDDFGTGFSGLNTLLELRPDIVKIDMSLVQKIEMDYDSRSLMFGIFSSVERLKMQLVAEGVENIDQVLILSQTKIDLMQGYFFARGEMYPSGLNRLPRLRRERS